MSDSAVLDLYDSKRITSPHSVLDTNSNERSNLKIDRQSDNSKPKKNEYEEKALTELEIVRRKILSPQRSEESKLGKKDFMTNTKQSSSYPNSPVPRPNMNKPIKSSTGADSSPETKKRMCHSEPSSPIIFRDNATIQTSSVNVKRNRSTSADTERIKSRFEEDKESNQNNSEYDSNFSKRRIISGTRDPQILENLDRKILNTTPSSSSSNQLSTATEGSKPPLRSSDSSLATNTHEAYLSGTALSSDRESSRSFHKEMINGNSSPVTSKITLSKSFCNTPESKVKSSTSHINLPRGLSVPSFSSKSTIDSANSKTQLAEERLSSSWDHFLHNKHLSGSECHLTPKKRSSMDSNQKRNNLPLPPIEKSPTLNSPYTFVLGQTNQVSPKTYINNIGSTEQRNSDSQSKASTYDMPSLQSDSSIFLSNHVSSESSENISFTSLPCEETEVGLFNAKSSTWATDTSNDDTSNLDKDSLNPDLQTKKEKQTVNVTMSKVVPIADSKEESIGRNEIYSGSLHATRVTRADSDSCISYFKVKDEENHSSKAIFLTPTISSRESILKGRKMNVTSCRVPGVLECNHNSLEFDRTRRKILQAHKVEFMASMKEDILKKSTKNRAEILRDNEAHMRSKDMEKSKQIPTQLVVPDDPDEYFIRIQRKLHLNTELENDESMTRETSSSMTRNTLSGLEETVTLKRKLMESFQHSTVEGSELRKYSSADARGNDSSFLSSENKYTGSITSKSPFVSDSFVSKEDSVLDLEASSIAGSKANIDSSISSKRGDLDNMHDSDGLLLANQGLAIAIPVQNESAPQFEPVFAEEYDPDDDKPEIRVRNRRLRCVSICFTVWILLVVAIGVLIAQSKKKRIIETPTPAPTMRPTTLRESEISRRILFISPYAADPGTFQHKALNWLIQDDVRQVNAEDPSLFQRYVLAVLYFATNGEDWFHCSYSRNNTKCSLFDSTGVLRTGFSFLSKETECLWTGVICAPTKVQSISLVSNNLKGPLPSEIGLLLNLQHLELQKNLLSGTLSPKLGELRNIAVIDLLENRLTGEIPLEWYSLNLIQKISLGSNSFTGSLSEKIQNLMNLRSLFIFNNSFTGSFPTNIGTLKTLGDLWIHQNQFKGNFPSEVGQLRTLRRLYIQVNSFNGTFPSEIGLLPSLEQLAIDNNKFVGSLPTEIFNLKSLYWLKANANRFSGTISAKIGNLKLLRTIDLSRNEFSGSLPSEIGSATHLTNAFFHFTSFTGDMPNSICSLRPNNLKYLFADCLGNNAPLRCSCCTACCDEVQQICYTTNPLER